MPRMSYQPGDVIHGIGTVGTASQIIASEETASLLLWADPANSGTIFIGDSDVATGDGYPRTGGQEFEGAIRANQVYVVGSAAGQVYRWIGIRL